MPFDPHAPKTLCPRDPQADVHGRVNAVPKSTAAGIERLSRNDDHNHHRLIRQLREAGMAKSRRLANLLAHCTEANPCRSAACVHCGRDFQRVAFDFVEQEIRGLARRDLRGRVSASTIVPAFGLLKPDDLTADACRSIAANIVQRVRDCDISTSALSLDISFNEDKAGKVECCVHTHGPILDWLTPIQDDALRAAFPGEGRVKRPVVVTPLDSSDTGPLYAFKPDRGRRVSYLNKRNPTRRPYWDTRRCDLRDWQAVDLAHVEHELGFDTRLMIRGIDEDAFHAALDAFYRARDGP